jgi:hypothetical protein
MSPCDVGVSPGRRFGRRIGVLVSLLLPTLLACEKAPPTPFARGQLVPVEDGGVRVTGVERISSSVLAGRGLPSVHQDWDMIVVYVRVEGAELTDVAKATARLLASTRLEARTGESYGRYPVPLTRDGYRLMISGGLMREGTSPRQMMRELELMTSREEASGRMPREWAVLFPVPRDASGFRLLVKNPGAKGDQPRLSSVDLGR